MANTAIYPNINFIIENEFNEAHCKEFIGRVYQPDEVIPSYAMFKNLPETLHRAFVMLQANKEIGVMGQMQMARAMMDALFLPKSCIDSLFGFWATTKEDYHDSKFNICPLYNEWVIKKCNQKKI